MQLAEQIANQKWRYVQYKAESRRGDTLPGMQVALAQLSSQLQRGLAPLYVLHGDEPLLQQEAADAIRAAARAQGYTERSSFTVAGAHFDWSAVLAAGGSLSLFADRQIIEIRIPSGKPGKDGSTALQQVAEGARGNDSTLTLVQLPRLDKATKTSGWFAALEGADRIDDTFLVVSHFLNSQKVNRDGRSGPCRADNDRR